MDFIKTLLGIVILVAIVVFGYWLYATYTMASADDEVWIKVNNNMPDPLRKWSCESVNKRFKTVKAPIGCNEFWRQEAEDSASSRPLISIERPSGFFPPAQSDN